MCWRENAGVSRDKRWEYSSQVEMLANLQGGECQCSLFIHTEILKPLSIPSRFMYYTSLNNILKNNSACKSMHFYVFHLIHIYNVKIMHIYNVELTKWQINAGKFFHVKFLNAICDFSWSLYAVRFPTNICTPLSPSQLQFLFPTHFPPFPIKFWVTLKFSINLTTYNLFFTI